MFGLGTGEILLIVVVIMLVFGGSRLPEIGRGLGLGMRGFRDALTGKSDDRADEKSAMGSAEARKKDESTSDRS